MATASAVTGLSSQSRPGLAARVARRLGGAVRTVMASGITLAGNLRRPVVPAFTRDPVAAGDLNAPVPPNASGAADQPRDAATPVASVEAARSGLLPRVLRHHRRRSPGGDTPFTPKNCPGLSREMCKLLNTPLGDCDPAMARMMFTALEEYFVGRLPADAGAEGAELVHAVIWGRLGGLFDEPGPDASPAEAADPASATPMEVVPASTANAAADAPAQATLVALTDAAPAAATHSAASVVAASAPYAETSAAPHAPSGAMAAVSPDTWPHAAKDATHDARLAAAPALPEGFLALLATALRGTPPMPPSPLCDTQAATLADATAVAAIAAAETTPNAAVPQKPGLRRNQSFLCRRIFLCRRSRSLFHRCRRLFGCLCSFLNRGSRDERRGPLSPPLLC